MNHYNHKDVADDCDKVAFSTIVLACILSLIGLGVVICQ